MNRPNTALLVGIAVAFVACAKNGTPAHLAVGEPSEGEAADLASPEEPRDVHASTGGSPVAEAYLGARANKAPNQRVGGAVQVELSQKAGGLYVFRPDKAATGLKAAFSNRFLTMYNATLDARIVDLTAADAASTEDTVDLTATWEDRAGNTYEVRCCTEVMAHGTDHPTFGGVVTNHMLHGFTGIGTDAVPSTFAYVATWGVGDVLKNGETLDSGVPMHLMVSDNVRNAKLQLVDDAGVNPGEQQLELIVAPMRPGADGEIAPVSTGYTMSGEELPFWHVVFPHYRMNVSQPSS